jgi:hypothetical protein
MKLSDGTYLMFGDGWLNKYKAHVDYVSITCVIQKGKQNILLQTNLGRIGHLNPQQNASQQCNLRGQEEKGPCPFYSNLLRLMMRKPRANLLT